MGDKSRPKYVSWRGIKWREPFLNGAPTPPSLVGTVRNYGYDRLGSNNPKYRAIIRSGGNATGGMTVTVQNAEAEDVNVELRRLRTTDPSAADFGVEYRSGITGVHLNLNDPGTMSAHLPLVPLGEACAEARRIVHKRLTARRRQFQGGVAALELKKTLQMVIRPAKSLRNGIAAATRRLPRIMKSLKRSGASRQSKAKILADTYLEMTFGWQPLLADTRDGALALARLATRDALERQQFRAYGSEEVPRTTTFGNNFGFGYDAQCGVSFDREWRDSSKAECIIYGRFRTRLQDSSYAKSSALRLAELSGFTLADFAPSAWEAMPWSFLVDYFTNVGDVIEAFSNNIGEIQWAAEVHIQESKEDFFTVVNKDATRNLVGSLLFRGVSDSRTHSWVSRKTVQRSAGLVTDLTQYLRLSLPSRLQWLNIGALALGARPPKPFY